MAEPNVNSVIIGPIVLYFAPTGTAFPSMATKPADAAWVTAGFSRVGYTEDGCQINTTPQKKDFIPDETLTPIKTVITGIAGELKTTLWENTLENLQRAIGLSVLSNPGTGIKTLSFGSGNTLAEYAIGVQGPGVGGVDSRVLTIWRCNSVSTLSQSYSRKELSKLACTFNLLTDSTKATTRDVWDEIEFNAGS